jgi:hypothetical protein
MTPRLAKEAAARCGNVSRWDSKMELAGGRMMAE